MDKISTVFGVKYKAIKQIQTQTFTYDEKTDIIPGVYEGGFTLWECSIDLLNYLNNIDFTNQDVIDIGCGLGVLGIKAI